VGENLRLNQLVMTAGIEYTPKETKAFKKQIVKTLQESVNGTFSGVCKKIGIGLTKAYKLKKEDPEFAAAVNEARRQSKEIGLDMAEAKLLEAINKGDMTGIIFYLKTQGKSRGFIEKIQTDVTMKPHEEALDELE